MNLIKFSVGVTAAMTAILLGSCATSGSNRKIASFNGINNDAAKELCEGIDKSAYPNTYKNCLPIAAQGKYNKVAITACSKLSFEPQNRVDCLQSIQNVRFVDVAAQACANLVANYVTADHNCLSSVAKKNYTGDQISSCNSKDSVRSIAECFGNSGTSMDEEAGY
jgi:hypothetical protein